MAEEGLLRVRHETGGLIRLAGEVDAANHDDLVAALRWAGGSVDSPVRLDVGELTFIDVTGVQLLLRHTRTRGLRLHRARPLLRRMIAMLDDGHVRFEPHRPSDEPNRPDDEPNRLNDEPHRLDGGPRRPDDERHRSDGGPQGSDDAAERRHER